VLKNGKRPFIGMSETSGAESLFLRMGLGATSTLLTEAQIDGGEVLYKNLFMSVIQISRFDTFAF